MASKGSSMLVQTDLEKAWTHPLFWGLIPIVCLAISQQIRWLNEAMKYYDNTKVVPLYYVTFVICEFRICLIETENVFSATVVASGILFQEFTARSISSFVIFLSGCLFSFFGVWLISAGREKEHGV